jgi:hypothetical protein
MPCVVGTCGKMLRRHLGYLLKGGSQFNKDFLACIYEYDDEDEFLFAWNDDAR